MSSQTPTIRTPFLITSKQFSTDSKVLQHQLIKSYTEIALAVNNRTIGIYDKFETITGNQFYNDDEPSKRRQSLRRVYSIVGTMADPLPSPLTTIPHEITIEDTFQLFQIYGAAQDPDLTNFVPLPYLNLASASGNIGLDMDVDNINIRTTTADFSMYSMVIVVEYYS